MKKSLRFAAVLLLAALIVAPAFAAGGAETSRQAAGTPEDPVTIELWFGAAITEAGMIPDDWVGYDIIRNELGIDLKLTMLPSSESDQDQKIQAAGAGNVLPDIFMVRRPVLVNLVNQGLVAQVDDCFEKMPNRTALIYDADAIGNATIDGHVYGFASPGAIVRNEGLLVRKDWLDNLGLDIPTTTDELMEVLRAFTFNDPDGNGKNDTYGYTVYLGKDEPARKLPFEVLRNDTLIQAVRSTDKKVVEAVFYPEAPVLKAKGLTLEVSAPCALVLRETDTECYVSVTDARMDATLKEITLVWNGQKIVVPMPQGISCGKSVTVCVKK